jgi:hypothetical protein
MNPAYVQTVNLLQDIAPAVFQTTRFAMKGGTALNLFVQDLPRLSVDIDVVFLNHQADRDSALKEIAQELQRMEAAIAAMGYETRTRKVHGGDEVKLDIFSAEAAVKVGMVCCCNAGSARAPSIRFRAKSATSLPSR